MIEWLADLEGDDQWVDSDTGVISKAGVVLGNHIIIWQDEPLTEDDKKDAVTDYGMRKSTEE